MKYYTPDLLARFASDDLEIARVAQRELETRADAYVAHLDKMKPRLPPRFAKLQNSFYLHDGRILNPSSATDPFLSHSRFPLAGTPQDTRMREDGDMLWIMIQPDPPPKEILVLHYRKVHSRALRRETTDYGEPCPYLEWGYDEVDLVEEESPLLVRHSILFTHGLEWEIVFEDFDFATLQPLTNGASRRGKGTTPAAKREARKKP